MEELEGIRKICWERKGEVCGKGIGEEALVFDVFKTKDL